jgi:prevent-host-death family protein
MASATLTGLFGLFGDEVYSSTDLNRRSAEVLDHARKRPVTISRNGEQFALLNREQASRLVRASCQFGPIIDLIEGALCVVEKKDPPTSVAWLKAFDVDDLRKMIREVLAASVSALHQTGDWDVVNSIIHEWHESALVELSGILNKAMNSPPEELPLPDPRLLMEAESQVASTARGRSQF